jgi:hypothetical protein
MNAVIYGIDITRLVTIIITDARKMFKIPRTFKKKRPIITTTDIN